MRDLLGTIRMLAWISVIAALYQELRKPPSERTWQGKVAGIVPYDFRVPTLERIRAAYWDPDSDTIFTDKVIGVGWAVNIPVAIRKLSEAVRQYSEASRQVRDEISRRVPQPSGRRGGDGRGPGQPA
jgi:hypothetical protein